MNTCKITSSSKFNLSRYSLFSERPFNTSPLDASARSSLDASLDESSPNLTIHTSYEINLQPRIENELLKKIISYDLSKWTQNNQTLTPGSQNNSIIEGKIIFPLTAKITYQ